MKISYDGEEEERKRRDEGEENEEYNFENEREMQEEIYDRTDDNNKVSKRMNASCIPNRNWMDKE